MDRFSFRSINPSQNNIWVDSHSSLSIHRKILCYQSLRSTSFFAIWFCFAPHELHIFKRIKDFSADQWIWIDALSALSTHRKILSLTNPFSWQASLLFDLFSVIINCIYLADNICTILFYILFFTPFQWTWFIDRNKKDSSAYPRICIDSLPALSTHRKVLFYQFSNPFDCQASLLFDFVFLLINCIYLTVIICNICIFYFSCTISFLVWWFQQKTSSVPIGEYGLIPFPLH